MDWGAFIIGLGGLLVAALTLLLSYKAKTSTYRETLYSKQFDAYAEVIEAFSRVEEPLIAAIAVIQFLPMAAELSNYGETLNAHRAAILKTLRPAYYTFHKDSLFLTEKMNRAVVSYVTTSVELVDCLGDRLVSKIPSNTPSMRNVTDTFDTIIQTARNDLGTEPLSTETLELIGKSHETSGKALR